jgi:ABC-type nickel/cobalt efflux system permease component RcnA
MHSAMFTTLAATGFIVALLHTSLPTHWLPFVMVGRAQGWTRGKTLAVAALAGGGHVAVTTLLGVGIAWFGFVMSERLDAVFHGVIAVILIGFGLYYWWRQITGRGCAHHHHHADEDESHGEAAHDGAAHEPPKTRDAAAIWSLFLLLTLSPCEGFLPVYLTAVPYGWRGVAWLALVLAAATLTGMLLLTSLTLWGLERFDPHILERYEAGLVGSLLSLLGALVFVIPS